jgi:hypothetical protein
MSPDRTVTSNPNNECDGFGTIYDVTPGEAAKPCPGCRRCQFTAKPDDELIRRVCLGGMRTTEEGRQILVYLRWLERKHAPETCEQPVAYVPIHPRTGPLWANTVPTLESERPSHYPVMALYAAPAPKAFAGRSGLQGPGDEDQNSRPAPRTLQLYRPLSDAEPNMAEDSQDGKYYWAADADAEIERLQTKLQWPASKAGEAPFCNCPEGTCAGWDEANNHGCCCRKACAP